jgi:hypothetical protein
VAAMQRLDDVWGMLIDKTQAQLVLSLVGQVTLYPDQMGLRWNQKGCGCWSSPRCCSAA